MAKKNTQYKRYEDYVKPNERTPWYNNLLFAFELTSALWAIGTFLRQLCKKKR